MGYTVNKKEEFVLAYLLNIGYTLTLLILGYMGYKGAFHSSYYNIVYNGVAVLIAFITFKIHMYTMKVVDKYVKTETSYYWLFIMTKMQLILSLFVIIKFIKF